jgi:Tfp pilus assembly protein FimT
MIAAPPLARSADRAAARGAAAEVAALLGTARRQAVARRVHVAVSFDTVRGRVTMHGIPGVPPVTRSLSARFGVAVRSTRDSLAFDPRGLGHGAANLSVMIRRGTAAETVVVSRLGRVRQ